MKKTLTTLLVGLLVLSQGGCGFLVVRGARLVQEAFQTDAPEPAPASVSTEQDAPDKAHSGTAP